MTPSWLHGSGIEAAATLFFAFTIGHALGDFPLQSEFLAKGKRRCPPEGPPPNSPPGLWVYCLSAHALTHAGLVWMISGRVGLGLMELMAHWLIDLAKGERRIGFHTDQWLHLSCKAFYVWIITRGVS
jgi:Protein of unknown function (DUF3307)